MTSTIHPPDRLNYTQRPPGYEVSEWTGPTKICARGWYVFSDPAENAINRGAPLYAQDEALERAWSHYKGRHDPPGMWVALAPEGGPWAWGDDIVGCLGWTDGDTDAHAAEARAAAWARYDDRLELAARVETCDGAVRPELAAKYWSLYGITTPFWPRCLAWSDESAAVVRKWLADSTMAMPDVLRG